VATRFKATIAQHGRDAWPFTFRANCLTEDYYVANN